MIWAGESGPPSARRHATARSHKSHPNDQYRTPGVEASGWGGEGVSRLRTRQKRQAYVRECTVRTGWIPLGSATRSLLMSRTCIRSAASKAMCQDVASAINFLKKSCASSGVYALQAGLEVRVIADSVKDPTFHDFELDRVV